MNAGEGWVAGDWDPGCKAESTLPALTNFILRMHQTTWDINQGGSNNPESARHSSNPRSRIIPFVSKPLTPPLPLAQPKWQQQPQLRPRPSRQQHQRQKLQRRIRRLPLLLHARPMHLQSSRHCIRCCEPIARHIPRQHSPTSTPTHLSLPHHGRARRVPSFLLRTRRQTCCGPCATS